MAHRAVMATRAIFLAAGSRNLTRCLEADNSGGDFPPFAVLTSSRSRRWLDVRRQGRVAPLPAHGATDMRLDDHFGSGSTLQRNERVKLAASFWKNVAAGMVIVGWRAFFLAPWGLGQNRYCHRRTCAWLVLLFNRQQHSHVLAHTARGASLSGGAASDEQARGREDNPVTNNAIQENSRKS